MNKYKNLITKIKGNMNYIKYIFNVDDTNAELSINFEENETFQNVMMKYNELNQITDKEVTFNIIDCLRAKAGKSPKNKKIEIKIEAKLNGKIIEKIIDDDVNFFPEGESKHIIGGAKFLDVYMSFELYRFIVFENQIVEAYNETHTRINT